MYEEMAAESFPIKQAYIAKEGEATVRIRVSGNRAWLTVKGRNKGAMRSEWEYEIPVREAEEMAVELAGGWSVEKERYIVEYEGWKWEVDSFGGVLSGLIIAEIEMPSAESRPPLPAFIGKEVTGDVRYYNSVLATAGRRPED